MPMPDFDLVAPTSLAELVRLKAAHGQAATILGGGTDLVVRLKQRLVQPEIILSVREVAELKGITEDPVFLTIGAGVTLAEVIDHPLVSAEFSGLVQALQAVGHPSCQHNSATLGGNLLLETRCLFYNQSAFWRSGHERCFKAGGQACLVNPDSKDCSSVYQSDGGPMLLAYSAQAVIASPAGERQVPVAELFSGQGENPLTLTEDELLAAIKLPRPVGETKAAYEKLAHRSAIDYPLVSAAAVISAEGTGIGKARLALAGCGPAPLLVTEADEILGGREPTPELIDQVAEKAARYGAGQVVNNVGSEAGYRREMIRVTARRALEKAIGL